MSENFEYYELDPPKKGDLPQLPPLFKAQEVLKNQNTFHKAISSASSGDVGTVFYSETNGILNIAITLGPEVIKSKAMQVHYLMMLGLSDAIAALAPPEIEVSHLWPNLMFMNRGLMGKILLFDSGGESNEIPSWIVSGVQIRRKVECDKFHKLIEATSLEDEGSAFLSNVRIIEAITRHFLVWLNTWQEEGFKSVHKTWLERLVPNFSVNDISSEFKGEWMGLDENGLALFKKNKNHFSLPLEDVNLK
jgi:biotin-(acetyl-CoA carboxylase) ligase|tara:strand:+ start:1135 stop:1881 length:747 start_codon:yes stop_codon:yes gene_type:complete